MKTLNRRSPCIHLLYSPSNAWRQLVLVWAVSITFAQAVWAAESTPSTAPVRVAIRAGKLLNVRTGEVATNVVIVVEGDRIAAVGGTVPESVQVIDLSSLCVLPGLVDCHAHILGNPKDESPTATLRM